MSAELDRLTEAIATITAVAGVINYSLAALELTSESGPLRTSLAAIAEAAHTATGAIDDLENQPAGTVTKLTNRLTPTKETTP